MSPRLKSGRITEFLRRLFGAPFRSLPPEFGDPVPPELRALEAEMAGRPASEAGPRAGVTPHRASRPARWDESLERQ